VSPAVPHPRRIIVVGGTGGLGAAVVDALLTRGDRVLATGRDPGRLESLAGRCAAAHRLDLGEPGCGAALADAFRRSLGDVLDGLVVAAGGPGPIGPTRTVDPAALVGTVDEHVGGALRVIQACAPLLDAAPAPGVVLFSGGGGVNAVAPGFVATAIHEATLSLDPDVVGPYYEETERRLRDATPPEVAAGLVAFLLSDESAGITGRLISAVWDPWQEEPRRAVLRGPTDFGRLRRIDAQRFHDGG
jgi:NAD(P)-dependent dehydrogenase (short-subunit alcohol dehydrogenase family)